MQVLDSPVDLVKQFLANFEKRQRNLVKRKSKLDTYREKLAKGEVLKDEQKKAVEGYESVVSSISLMQEMATQSKELLNAIEKSSVVERSKIELELEERTISFLQVSTSLQRFLSTLDNPSVRDAIIKSTSEGNLKFLDAVRSSVTAPLIDDLPGTSASALAETPSHLQSREDLKCVSQNLYNLVVGRSIPIPTLHSGDHPKKHSNFKDARNLCFRLMANPTIQHSMGIHKAADISQSSVNGDHIQNSSNGMHDALADRTNELNEQCVNQIPNVASESVHSLPIQQGSFPEVPGEQLIDHIKPISNTFNFLQASRVEVPVQLPAESPSYGQPAAVISSDNNGVSEFLNDAADEEANSSSHSVEKHNVSDTLNGERAENGTLNFQAEEPVEVVEPSSHLGRKPDFVDEEIPPTASKPISYADSVRKSSFTGPCAQRFVSETHSANRKIEKTRENNREDRGDLPHQNTRNGYSRGGAYRGRPNNFDGRGDRGAPRRGFGSRPQNHYGRGGAARGMAQEIEQATY